MEFSDILDQLDFFELVSTKVKLTKSGNERYRGLSPFTNEKTPSFYIDNQSKTWYCFSSGEGGGVIDYIRRSEGIDRPEAIQFLKDYLNIEDDNKKENSKDVRAKNLLREAHKEFLRNKSNAVFYLQKRGISEEDAQKIVDKYEIGFCEKSEINEKSSTVKALESKGFPVTLQKELGICYENGKCRYENRITIPIKNEYGQIVSFTGRDVTGEARSKYLHGTSSYLFKKSNIAWNLSTIRSMVEEQDRIIVCEGQMDAIAVTEAGIPAVSIMGSKISENQLKSLAKISNNIYMIFDSDRAGEEGLLASFKMISDLGIDSVFYSIVLSGNKDPDDFIKENGVDKFVEIVDQARPDTSHIIEILLKKIINKGTYNSKPAIIRKVLSDLSPYIKKSYNYRSLDLIERLSQELGLSRKELQEWMDSGTKFSSSKKTLEKIEDIQFPAPVYERRILYLILKNPEFLNDFNAQNLSIYDFESPLVSKIIELVDPRLSTNEIFDILKDQLNEQDYDLLISFFSQGLLEADFETSLDVLKAKVHFRAKKSAKNFLGRPITATEVEFKRVVGDVISYGKEPF